MKIRHKTPPPQFRGFIAGVIVASFVCNAMQPATAAVGDNLDSAFTVLAEALGIGKESSIPDEDKFETASLIEKINYLEEQLDNQNKDFDVKLNNQTAALQESIEESVQAANAAYSLYVYIPKSEAQADYSGDTIKITSESGNQNATARFHYDGVNYSTTLHFNFSGDCKLDYVAKNDSGDTFDITEAVNVAATGQEHKIGSASYKYSFYFPKEDALIEGYEGQQIRISNGSDYEVATLRDDGENYSATIYANFTGSATLQYNLLSQTYGSEEISRAMTLADNSNTTLLPTNLVNGWSWDFAHEVCQANLASKYFAEGYALPNSWYIIGFGTDTEGVSACKIWTKTDLGLGTADWETTNKTAAKYWTTFNTKFANYAYKSGLLSHSDIKTDWLRVNYVTGVMYWLEGEFGSDFHYTVWPDGRYADCYDNNSNPHGCYPYVWIH